MKPGFLPEGAQRIGPGMYRSNTSTGWHLHIVASEMCEHLGVPATKEYMNAVANAALETATEMGSEFRESWQR